MQDPKLLRRLTRKNANVEKLAGDVIRDPDLLPQILDGVNCRDLILKMINEQIDEHLGRFLSSDYGVESYAAEASRQAARLED